MKSVIISEVKRLKVTADGIASTTYGAIVEDGRLIEIDFDFPTPKSNLVMWLDNDTAGVMEFLRGILNAKDQSG